MTQNEYSGNNVAESMSDDEHCGHECMCREFRRRERLDLPCEGGIIETCQYDTRSRPAPSQQQALVRNCHACISGHIPYCIERDGFHFVLPGSPEQIIGLKEHDAEVAAKAVIEAILEQRHRVGKKLIEGICDPDGDCARCILCDNAGGCLAEWSKQVQVEVSKARKEGYAEGAAAERERVFRLVRNVINTDASGLAGALDKVRTLAKGYSWIPDGEWGSYDYTQRTTGTLQKEVGYLLEELEKITYEGLRDSGERVNAHIISVEESLRSSQQPENRQQEPDPTLGSIP